VNAEVFAYSRARGLFAGIALDGTAITMDNKGNRNFYNKPGVLPSEIMAGTVSTDSENARRFLSALAASTGENAAAAPATPAAPAPGSAPAAPAGPAVKTFPMEDPAPGKEPR
jgi:lipid-binding SYLF domain-containing protein